MTDHEEMSRRCQTFVTMSAPRDSVTAFRTELTVEESVTLENPLIVVLEDLHWSDYSTLDVVSYLARRPDSARLMVIGTYRPVDVIMSDHPLKGVKRELHAHGLCHELPLEFLSEEAIGSYIFTRFPGHQFPAGLRRTI